MPCLAAPPQAAEAQEESKPEMAQPPSNAAEVSGPVLYVKYIPEGDGQALKLLCALLHLECECDAGTEADAHFRMIAFRTQSLSVQCKH